MKAKQPACISDGTFYQLGQRIETGAGVLLTCVKAGINPEFAFISPGNGMEKRFIYGNNCFIDGTGLFHVDGVEDEFGMIETEQFRSQDELP